METTTDPAQYGYRLLRPIALSTTLATVSPNAASALLRALAACWLLLASVAPAAGEARDVLVLYSNNRLLPANIEGDRGLREALPEGAELSAEFLDYPRITGEAYLAALIRFLREKYATRPPAVIVAGGPDALAFVLSRRAELFPQVPVVHMGVPRARLRALPPLPADVVGVPFDLDFSATIDQALRWHPSARRLVFVTGSAAPDRGFETLLREEAVRFQDRVATEFLAGLPTDALLQRLGELDGESVVFTPGYFQDGAGRNFFPREAV